MACYAQGLLFFYLAHYINPGEGMNLNVVFAGATLLALGVGAGVIWKGFQTAHRLAGVHIKLMNTFHRIAAGEPNVNLKFRAYDRLENLEVAFAAMMESLTNPHSKEV
jgi:nitrogen fixation/metabolism regulation signal transduction histidine kinase